MARARWPNLFYLRRRAHDTLTDKKLDATGLFCPEPVFRTKIEMEGMEAGAVLTVTADDPAAEEDISSWASRSGHEVLSVSHEGSRVTLSIRK